MVFCTNFKYVLKNQNGIIDKIKRTWYLLQRAKIWGKWTERQSQCEKKEEF